MDYFQYCYLLELFVFVCLFISSGLKIKNYLKMNILIIERTCKALVSQTLIKMDIKSLEIKTKTIYNWDDIVCINNFDVNTLDIIKRESRIGANIYYIGYVLKPDYDYNTIKPLYFVINRLIGYIEEIEGSSDKYLVVAKSVRNKDIIRIFDMLWVSIENKIEDKINPIPNNYPDFKIKDYDKYRFNSETNLPLDVLIEFRSLVINVSCVIEKYNKYYPEIYLDECLYVKDKVRQFSTLKKYNI